MAETNDREFFVNLKRTSKERFDISKFLEYTDNYDPLTSNLFQTIKNLPEKKKYFVQSEEGRPDLVSYNLFKNTQYWWIILIYNDLISADDLQVGKILSIPGIDDLEDLFFSLRSKEVASNT